MHYHYFLAKLKMCNKMKIILNNTAEEIQVDYLSVKELLEIKNFTFKMIVVKVNGQLIKQTFYENTFIKDGDEVAVMHLVSGG